MEHTHYNDTLYHSECPRCKLDSISPLLLEACEEALDLLKYDQGDMQVVLTNEERRVYKLLESAIRKAKAPDKDKEKEPID